MAWWEATRQRRFDPTLLLDMDVRAWWVARQCDAQPRDLDIYYDKAVSGA